MSEEKMREELDKAITMNCGSYTINKKLMIDMIIGVVKKHEEVIEMCNKTGIKLPLMISTWNKKKPKNDSKK